ncbi:MAG: CtsR family transcriptional regulator [bacterium]
MATLADYIEEYLQSLFEEQETVELQRRMLANRFQCVPSQINYVLSTRFTLAKGYVVETRRGEGGYIRIQKLPSLKDVKNEVIEEIGDALSSKEAFELLHFLVEKGLLTQREEHFLRIILQEAGKGLKVEDNVRANIIRSLFLTFL